VPRPRSARRSLPVVVATRWSPELLGAVAEGERKVLGPLVATDPIGAAEEASRRAEELIARASAKEPPPLPVACGPRCPSCCVSKVVVAAPEILRIAAYLRDRLAPEELEVLRSRVRAADDRSRDLSRRERAVAGIACPLLVEGSCSVHPVRPLICRAWTSLDRRACEQHFANPDGAPVAPAHTLVHELGGAVLGGLTLACADAGRDADLLELNAALRIALDHPDASGRWTLGRPVFSPAHDRTG